MYPTYFFGFKLKTIIKFIEGNNTFCKYLSVKKNPSFLLNLNLFKTESLANLFTIMKERLMSISKNITKNNFNYIYPDIDLYNKLYLNIQTKYKDTDLNMLDCLYLLNVDKNFDYFAKNANLANIYTIYQGHHYNKYIDYARMILPVKPYIQELGSFVNVQGDILHIDETIKDDNLAVKNNILVLYSVFTTLFNTLKQNFKQVIDNNDYDHYNPSRKSIKDSLVLYNNIKLQNNYLKNYTINSSLYKFYANDNISLASQLMSNCNKTLVKRSNY